MVNAYSTVPGDGDVVLEYVQWAHLSLGAPVEGQRPNPGGPVRAVIDPFRGTMHRTQLDDSRIEPPGSATD